MLWLLLLLVVVPVCCLVVFAVWRKGQRRDKVESTTPVLAEVRYLGLQELALDAPPQLDQLHLPTPVTPALQGPTPYY